MKIINYDFLATDIIYISMALSKKIIDRFLKHLEIVFKNILKYEIGDDIYKYWITNLSLTDFERLN